MKFIIYSDVHSQELILPNYEPDFVLLLGDIDWRDVKKIDNHFNCPKLGVLGNHDVLDTFRNTNINYLHEKVININGITFAGFGGCPRYNNKQNVAQYEEYEASKFVDSLKEVDIFLAHSNPMYEYNSDTSDAHRGFKSFDKLFNNNKVRLFFHGHIHQDNEFKYRESIIVVTYGYREYDI